MLIKDEWRDVKGHEEFFKINSFGIVIRKERVIEDSLGRKRKLKESRLNLEPSGRSYHLRIERNVRSVAVSTLIRENFPELTQYVNSLPGEVWRKYDKCPLYLASNFGRIKREERSQWNGSGLIILPEILISPSTNADGYLYFGMNLGKEIRTLLVHRVIAECFVGTLNENLAVDHLDFNRKNNRPENLSITVQSENIKRSWAAGRYDNRLKKG